MTAEQILKDTIKTHDTELLIDTAKELNATLTDEATIALKAVTDELYTRLTPAEFVALMVMLEFALDAA